MKTFIALALLAMGHLTCAKPLETVNKTLNKKIAKCRLAIDYVLVNDSSPSANKTNALITKIVNQRDAEFASISADCTADPNLEGRVESTIKLTFSNSDFSTWEESYSGYAGGAHGAAAANAMVVDSNGDRVSFADVLNVPAFTMIESIHAKVQATLADRYAEDFFQQWASNKDVLTNLNYTANAKGVTVLFNQYEIAPYAAGFMSIDYTWAELKPMLKANSPFRELLN